MLTILISWPYSKPIKSDFPVVRSWNLHIFNLQISNQVWGFTKKVFFHPMHSKVSQLGSGYHWSESFPWLSLDLQHSYSTTVLEIFAVCSRTNIDSWRTDRTKWEMEEPIIKPLLRSSYIVCEVFSMCNMRKNYLRFKILFYLLKKVHPSDWRVSCRLKRMICGMMFGGNG